MIRRLFSWYLTIVVVLTHVGIPVFAHICHGKGEMWFSMILPSNASCHTKADRIDNQNACLEKSLPSTTVNAKPCCENQTGLLKIESSYCSSLPGNESKEAPSAAVIDFSFEGIFFLHAGLYNPGIERDHAPPVQIYGRELCIRLQDFRC